MKAFQEFAIIKSNKVKQIGCYNILNEDSNYTLANQIAKKLFGRGAYAVDVTYVPVQEGDGYVNGQFTRAGIPINPLPSEEEEIKELSATIDDIIIAMTPEV